MYTWINNKPKYKFYVGNNPDELDEIKKNYYGKKSQLIIFINLVLVIINNNENLQLNSFKVFF